ncbi:DUF3299 domain-containing protein [Ekhidna sp.]
MTRILFVILLNINLGDTPPTKITWETLEDVSFTDKYSEEEKAYYYYPDFGSSVKSLEGKEVFIKGFMLPIEPEEGIFILSRNPFASCFFCGNGGPESIIELKLKAGYPKFKMDQVVTIRGKLKLNSEDIYQCNYILEGAEIYRFN